MPPATFSGGEQQRVNLARGFIGGHPVLLLDEPTASLDAENRAVVVAMINEAKARGTAIIAICHDADVRDAIADRLFARDAVAGCRMTDETILTNAILVLPDATLHGTLVMRGGTHRRRCSPAAPRRLRALDLDGDYLIPGIVDVHTDNLERQVQPRITGALAVALRDGGA